MTMTAAMILDITATNDNDNSKDTEHEVGRVLPRTTKGGTDPSITNIYSLGQIHCK